MTSLTAARSRVDSLLARRAYAARRLAEETHALALSRQRSADAEEAQRLLQSVAEQVQNSAHKRLASVVTRCLQAVFQDDREFVIRFERKRGRTEARFAFLKEGKEEDPTSASCCGAVDVASLALRIACLLLLRPAKRRLIVADEPLKWLNGEQYQERVAGLLPLLAEEFGIQLIIATDDDWLKIGEVVQL